MIYDDPSMLHAMKQVKKLKTDGERTKFLDDYFGSDDSSRCAVACLRCQDSGYAMIYQPAVIVAAAAGKDPAWHKRLAVRCNCDAGLRMPVQSREQAARSAKHADDKDYTHGVQPTYGDAVWHIAVNDPDGKAKCINFELRSLHEWNP